MTAIKVEWSNGNQQWVIVGGNLPQGTCWSAHDSREEAVQEAREVASDLGVEFLN